jgi:hypothetical protein
MLTNNIQFISTMNLKVLRGFANPKKGMMEAMLKSVLPMLNQMLEKINKPKEEGGLLGPNDFTAGITIVSNNQEPIAMLVTLGTNENGETIITSKIPISELSNVANDETNQ